MDALDEVAAVTGEVTVLAATKYGRGVRLEYFGFDWDPHLGHHALMELKVQALEQAGHRVIDHQAHYDPTATPRKWGWVIYEVKGDDHDCAST